MPRDGPGFGMVNKLQHAIGGDTMTNPVPQFKPINPLIEKASLRACQQAYNKSSQLSSIFDDRIGVK